ncbi:MAG: alpha-glucuronidase [Bacteroidales bacterium]|nr:alpha-glucuronidase [Bacteroidales bacterium]
MKPMMALAILLGSLLTVMADNGSGLWLRNLDANAALQHGAPAYPLRLLNHWDNLDGTIERGYAGSSIWEWDQLPDSVNLRYQEYARANASIGINGVVLNNVNASPQILTSEYLAKVKALADVMRPYGIKVYLSVNFASPMAIGGLDTADPLEPAVMNWWSKKADEIYALIPDFGGFLVKANSEGQPGPCDFGRTHADGANMLAAAMAPHGGIVIWRAFVYSPTDADRAKQAYLEFVPLDGQFADNVIIQIKNGPIDFQPREPYSPLFDGLKHTPMMVEFQITQEYLGASNHLVYLAPLYKEFFKYVDPKSLVGMAGVANIGNQPNWTGHPFAQANWFAFGRLANDPTLSSDSIAREWVGLTFPEANQEAKNTIVEIMMRSREACVDYMMPMGLHHIFAFGHHYGPEPWCDVSGAREDWLPRYYHRADSLGLGFDRSSAGSNAVAQYREDFAQKVENIDSCPDELLLWFHHVPWTKKMADGNTLWENLCRHYQHGVDEVDAMAEQWQNLNGQIDPEIFADVADRLEVQQADARWWRDACILYFNQYNLLPIPSFVQIDHNSLTKLMNINLKISNFEAPNRELLDSVR